MYDIRQFKPTLYLLVILGLTGFAMAAEVPGLWVLSVGAILLNAWLVWTGRFTPMPRWLANVVTLLSVVYVLHQIARAGSARIDLIGEFLVLLQLVKFFEQRANRDYGQLIVLSVLLIIAGSISTASLLFAFLLTFYVFLPLYGCSPRE